MSGAKPFAPRAVLFDLDGVLVDSYQVWFHLLNDVASTLGYPPVTSEQYEASWGQSTYADRQAFFPNHAVAEIQDSYDTRYADHLEHLGVPDGVEKVFARLASLGLKSAVCTNTQASIAANAVKLSGATPDVIVGGDDVPHGKPAPDMIARACELLGEAPDSAWMVGDSRYDREAAAAAGVLFVGRGIDGDFRVEVLSELLDWL